MVCYNLNGLLVTHDCTSNVYEFVHIGKEKKGDFSPFLYELSRSGVESGIDPILGFPESHVRAKVAKGFDVADDRHTDMPEPILLRYPLNVEGADDPDSHAVACEGFLYLVKPVVLNNDLEVIHEKSHEVHRLVLSGLVKGWDSGLDFWVPTPCRSCRSGLRLAPTSGKT